MPRPSRTVTEPSVLAIARLIKLLARGDLSMTELGELSGLSMSSVHRYCGALHQVKAVHIHAWRRDGRNAQTIRLYMLGEGVDAEPVVTPGGKRKQRAMERVRQAAEQATDVPTDVHSVEHA